MACLCTSRADREISEANHPTRCRNADTGRTYGGDASNSSGSCQGEGSSTRDIQVGGAAQPSRARVGGIGTGEDGTVERSASRTAKDHGPYGTSGGT